MLELEAYTSHFDDPFGAKLYRYFLTPELSQRLNLIRHLLQNSEQLLLVLAENGCGKTALLNQLKKIAAQQCEHWWVYTLESSPALSPEALISKILAEFHVRQDGKPVPILQESLRSHIAATRYNGQLPILLVDDAHMLPLATLKLIVDLAMQGEALTRMRVGLFCEPQMTSILATPEFNIVHNTLIHTLDVPPFSKTQVRDYLQFRLQNSQYNHIHPFTSEVIKKISVDTEGIPGEINLAAQQILRQFAEQRPHIPTLTSSWSYSKLRWGIPIILVLLSIAGLIYWQSFKPSKEISSLPTINNSLPTEQPSASLFDEVPVVNPVLPAEETDLPDQIYSPEANSDLTTLPPMEEPQGDSLLESVSSEPVDSAALPSAKESSSTIQWLDENHIKGEDWLRYQNPNAYTIQVLGAHDQETLKKFLAQHPLADVAMFKTSYHDKNWYVLVHGIYSNRSTALAALEKLPVSLRQSTQPWARTLASIQKLINSPSE
jgi:DamX protein